MRVRTLVAVAALVAGVGGSTSLNSARAAEQGAKPQAAPAAVDKNYPLPYPPKLPDGKDVVTDTAPEFLKPTGALRDGVTVAKTPPTITFLYYPGQDHAGRPWSNWGEPTFANGKFYSAIGDHLAPGTALVTEFDPATNKIRVLADVARELRAAGEVNDQQRYAPGKIHSRLRMGSDGWLYYATHRGSTKATSDANGYKGDWILRTDPRTAKTEVVACGAVPKHAIPMSGLDPARMIFYGGTAEGTDATLKGVQFLAFDLKARKPLLIAPDGPPRCAIFSSSTGKVYWDGKRYDPATNRIEPCAAAPDVRSSTDETPGGIVYGTTQKDAKIWAFDVKAEKLEVLSDAAVADQTYITSLVADPAGRFLYYVPGAHGKASASGTPVVQFDTKTRTRKVIAFLSPFYKEKYGYTPDGTFGVALDDKGESLYVTWNGFRPGQPKFWESCALTRIQIPEGERK